MSDGKSRLSDDFELLMSLMYAGLVSNEDLHKAIDRIESYPPGYYEDIEDD